MRFTKGSISNDGGHVLNPDPRASSQECHICFSRSVGHHSLSAGDAAEVK